MTETQHEEQSNRATTYLESIWQKKDSKNSLLGEVSLKVAFQ